MQQITSDMKVAEVIRRCPETADVFSRRGGHTTAWDWHCSELGTSGRTEKECHFLS